MTDVPVTLDALITSVRSAAPDEPLAQLEEAARLEDEVGELTDALLGHFVDQARRGRRLVEPDRRGPRRQQAGRPAAAHPEDVLRRARSPTGPASASPSAGDRRPRGSATPTSAPSTCSSGSSPSRSASPRRCWSSAASRPRPSRPTCSTSSVGGRRRPDGRIPHTPRAARVLVGSLDVGPRAGPQLHRDRAPAAGPLPGARRRRGHVPRRRAASPRTAPGPGSSSSCSRSRPPRA